MPRHRGERENGEQGEGEETRREGNAQPAPMSAERTGVRTGRSAALPAGFRDPETRALAGKNT